MQFVKRPDLTLRTEPSGGDALIEIHGVRGAFLQRRRYIILVHGFNNSEKSANENYEIFRWNIRRVAATMEQDVLTLSWPGDVGNQAFTAVLYHKMVERAVAAAPVLADYLVQSKGPGGTSTEIILIAHSLGCRLVLEAIRHLAQRRNYDKRNTVNIFLMAAAVPVDAVSLEGALREAATLAQIRAVFYSNKDTVLSRAFPLGQTVGREGFMPEAVGLNGNPSAGLWTIRQHMEGFGHGDYWRQRDVVEHVAAALGYAVGRPLPEWQISERPELPSHVAMATNPLSGRIV
jgi:esterase/lipase superfamily enzyme